MAIDEVQFRQANQAAFYNRPEGPLTVGEISHSGFKEMRWVGGASFHADPVELWRKDFLFGWKSRAARKMPRLDEASVAQALDQAAKETSLPQPSVSLLLHVDKPEPDGADTRDGAVPAHPWRHSTAA